MWLWISKRKTVFFLNYLLESEKKFQNFMESEERLIEGVSMHLRKKY